jgi:mRNA-degrading endonuclease RelE of RelBE toxin-antitoxin system
MQILFSNEFNKQLKKTDKVLRERVLNIIGELEKNSRKGKPLMYELKECRSIRISSFRLVYFVEDDSINIVCFEKRKTVYEKLAKYINYNTFYI